MSDEMLEQLSKFRNRATLLRETLEMVRDAIGSGASDTIWVPGTKMTVLEAINFALQEAAEMTGRKR